MHVRCVAASSVASGLLATVSLPSSSAFAQTDIQEVTLSQDVVSPEAQGVAKVAAPNVAFDRFSMELNENGHPTVEMSGLDAFGDRVEVDLIQEAGTWYIEEIERLITWNDTPGEVRTTLSAMFLEDWTPDVIERSERASGYVIYEIEGRDASGDTIELEVYATGELITINKDSAS